MNRHWNLFARLLLTALLLPLPAYALSGAAIEGRVFEDNTNKPIEGAIVVVLWSAAKFAFVESRAGCVHVDTATTDAQGRYRFPAWRKPSDGFITDMAPIVSAYKAGYTQPLFEGPTLVHLKPFAGTKGERLEYLLRISSATRCGNAGNSEKNLLPLKRALYQEASAIASTKEDEEKVETLLFGLESLELGSTEALNRMTERRKVRK